MDGVVFVRIFGNIVIVDSDSIFLNATKKVVYQQSKP